MITLEREAFRPCFQFPNFLGEKNEKKTISQVSVIDYGLPAQDHPLSAQQKVFAMEGFPHTRASSSQADAC